MSRRLRPRRSVGAPAVALLAGSLFVVGLAGCSSDEDASPSSTTTGIADPITTTTRPPSPTTSGSSGSDLPGLWLASPQGISDETGEVWATPRGGERLISPLSDGIGGVIYLRCSGAEATCSIEDVPVQGTDPVPHGRADSLFAVGMHGDRRVLLASVTDPTIVPSFEEDRSQLVAQMIELDSGTITPLPGWFGWESGPFAADVEQQTFVQCAGEGEECGLTSGADPAAMTPLDGTDRSTVLSLALDAEAKRLTWADAAPMTGEVRVHVVDLPGGQPSMVQVRPESSTPPDDVVTDGTWVAVRTGADVAFVRLAADGPAATEGATGKLTVPDGVTEMSLRESGGGAGAASAL